MQRARPWATSQISFSILPDAQTGHMTSKRTKFPAANACEHPVQAAEALSELAALLARLAAREIYDAKRASSHAKTIPPKPDKAE
jgi:hypothetical protein